MEKSKRLIDLMMWINARRKFTLQEVTDTFRVSRRTAIRDLQELSAVGVPLYSRAGSGGGYEVLRNRMLPPIAFTVEEATSMFFAYQSLEKFSVLPFASDVKSALNRFYQALPNDTKAQIDHLRGRLSYMDHQTLVLAPNLRFILEASLEQQVVLITYESKTGITERSIQPIGVYAKNGLWYCPAYCFYRESMREFRIDRIHSVSITDRVLPRPDVAKLTLDNWYTRYAETLETLPLRARLSQIGVRELTAYRDSIQVQADGTGVLQLDITRDNVPFFGRLFVTLGRNAVVESPEELVEFVRSLADEIQCLYAD